MWIIDLWRWRISRHRVAADAWRLLDQHGVRAFFHAHEHAWSAQGEGRVLEARYHRAVCYAISRHLQRRAILEAILAPPERNPARRRETNEALHMRLLRDLA